MTSYKDFSGDAEIEYSLIVTVNDEQAIKVTAYDEEGLILDMHKVDKAIEQTLENQYYDQSALEQDDDPEWLREILAQ